MDRVVSADTDRQAGTDVLLIKCFDPERVCSKHAPGVESVV